MDTICINIGACEHSAVKSKRDADNCECEHWCEHYEDSKIAFKTVSHYCIWHSAIVIAVSKPALTVTVVTIYMTH